MSEEGVAEELRVALRGRPDTDRGELAELVRHRYPLTGPSEVSRLVDRALARSAGLGPILELLADEAVSEIMVVGGGRVWVDRAGSLADSGLRLDPGETGQLIERVLDPLGLRVDRLSPMVDARLPDGSRVHVIIPPLALDGPTITIRRFSPRSLSIADFADRSAARVIRSLVRSRATLLVVGGTGTGKTTLLNAIGAEIARSERVVTIEDTAELALPGDHVVRLEARPANREGAGEVTIRDLVKASLRMRPDRIVVGEVRGAEALDLLLALSSGHRGSLATCHAGTAAAALNRLATLALLGGVDLPMAAVTGLIADSIDAVIVVERRGAKRFVAAISEVGDAMSTTALWTLEGEKAADLRTGGYHV